MPFGVGELCFWPSIRCYLAVKRVLLGYQKSTSWSPEVLLPRGLRIGFHAVSCVFLGDVVLVGLLDLQADERRLGVLLGGGVNLNLRNSFPEGRCKVTTYAERFQIFAVFWNKNFSLGVIVVSEIAGARPAAKRRKDPYHAPTARVLCHLLYHSLNFWQFLVISFR